MRIATVVGARPQFIKAAAGSRQLRKKHEEILIHTGQHFDTNMSEVFFTEMGIPEPDYNLGISGGTHAELTGRMLIELEKIFIKIEPDVVLLYGDTNSTLAGALAAVKLLIPVIHVEAGNRLGTLDNPEEVNRIITDHCSSLLLCATESAYQELKNEGLDHKAHITGNIMYDSFLYFLDRIQPIEYIKDLWGNLIEMPREYNYLTCHRQENTNGYDNLREILEAADNLGAPTIYPVHPRNRDMVIRLYENYKYTNVFFIEPVKYSESVFLVSHAQKVITDSGGLQCEAFYSEVQCVTVFDHVAWPETMVDNRNQLARPDKEDILEKFNAIQTINPHYKPFGDGKAAENIVQRIESFFKNKETIKTY